ncbi:MAG: MmgE/PrpD family protein, partial [Candidatus Hodarchaeota archaeon]
MEATKKLSEFVTSTEFDDLSPEVINEAKLCFIDWLGLSLAGSYDPEVTSLFDVIKLIGGNEQATVLGKKIRTSTQKGFSLIEILVVMSIISL